jgi:hypothetical protein
MLRSRSSYSIIRKGVNIEYIIEVTALLEDLSGECTICSNARSFLVFILAEEIITN